MAYTSRAMKIENKFKKSGIIIDWEYDELILIDIDSDDVIGYDEIKEMDNGPELIILAEEYVKIISEDI